MLRMKLLSLLIKHGRRKDVGQRLGVACVNTWSPLAAAFNRRRVADSNSTKTTGLFGTKELAAAEGFDDLKSDVLSRANELVNTAIVKSPSQEVVSIFDNLSDELCKVADLAEFIRLAHPDERFAKAAESASFEVGGFVEHLNTHHDLYKALKASVDFNSSNMDAVTKTVADLFLFDFHQSGIHLDGNKRNLSVKLLEAALVLGAQFSQGTVSPRLFPSDDWPRDLSIPFRVDGANLIVDSSYGESGNARMREYCYKAYMTEDRHQLELLEGLLNVRYRLANMLGFDSFSHRTLKGSMGEDPQRVLSFLEETLDMLRTPLAKELDTMMRQKKVELRGAASEVMPWDVRYYTSVLTSHIFNLNARKLSEYFSLGGCMEGLNLIFTSLYGVALVVEEPEPGELWSPDVLKVCVKHEQEGVLGYIYCDFYSRPGKLPQDSHFTIRGGRELPDGSYQNPIVCLFCNFSRPSPDMPALLSQSMVENLFHEMGHAMHSMLGRARYQHVTGTRCATDFAEVPSILMEHFAMDPRILPLYAKHYQSGEPLPQDIIDALVASKKLFSAMDLQTQTFYSIVDQKFHGQHPLGKSTTELLVDLHREYSPLPHSEGSAWHLRFGHFHSYAAKYYSYVWSKAVALRIWQDCFSGDPLSRSAGEKYRRTMLAHGGGVPPQKLVNNMLGHDVTIRDLVNSLQEDILS